MSSVKERLQVEYSDLGNKIELLENFIGSEKFENVSPVQQTLLIIQLDAMKTYRQVLSHRIQWLDD